MSSANCKAITKSGEKCKLKANSSGYCHIHDPEKIAEYEAKKHLPEIFAIEVSAKTFSQRRGLKPISEIIQIDNMNDDLRNSLWNVLSTNFFLQYSKFVEIGFLTHIDIFIKFLWDKYFKYPLDQYSSVKHFFSSLCFAPVASSRGTRPTHWLLCASAVR